MFKAVIFALLVAMVPFGSAPAQAATYKIAFRSYRDGGYALYTINPDGTDERRLTTGPVGSTTRPAWSPDGRRITYHDGNDQIWIIDADGQNARPVVGQAMLYTPGWSPDNNQFVYVSNRDGNPEIYTATVDGKILVRLTENTSSDHSPAWSPDGRHIAFLSDRDGSYKLYITEPDGSNQRPLVNDSIGTTLRIGPWWAPNSRQLAVFLGPEEALYRVDLAGNKQLIIANLGGYWDKVAWSPDSKRLAVGLTEDIFIVDVTGKSRRNLTNSARKGQYSYTPVWRPDGRQIAFAAVEADGTQGIYVIDLNGRNMRRLSVSSRNSSMDPVWQPVAR